VPAGLFSVRAAVTVLQEVTVVDPAWKLEQMAQPGTLSPQAKEQLLSAREAVWRAWFTNDQAQLTRQAQILEDAQRAARAGNKLVRLEFPKTEIQVYGTTAIIYTTYLFELETPQGQRQTSTGKATEIFVRRNGGWVNPGWHMASAAK